MPTFRCVATTLDDAEIARLSASLAFKRATKLVIAYTHTCNFNANRDFAFLLSVHTSVTTLVFAHSICDDFLHALIRRLRGNATITSIRSDQLSSFRISDLFVSMLDNMPAIRELTVDRVTPALVSMLMRKQTPLRHLHIRDGTTVTELLRANCSVYKLGLSSMGTIDDMCSTVHHRIVHHFASGLRSNSVLQALVLDFIVMTNNHIITLVDALRENGRRIHTLSLEFTNMIDTGLGVLLSHAGDNGIRSLAVGYNNLTDAGIAMLRGAIVQGKLYELACVESGSSVSEQAMCELVRALHNNDSMISLRIGGSCVTDNVMACLRDVLPTCPHLSRLDLYRCWFNEAGLCMLADALNDATELRVLGIQFPQQHTFTANAVARLARTISENQTLHTLSITESAISESDVCVLADAVAQNRTLHKVVLSVTSSPRQQFSMNVTLAIQLALARNDSLCKFDVPGAPELANVSNAPQRVTFIFHIQKPRDVLDQLRQHLTVAPEVSRAWVDLWMTHAFLTGHTITVDYFTRTLLSLLAYADYDGRTLLRTVLRSNATTTMTERDWLLWLRALARITARDADDASIEDALDSWNPRPRKNEAEQTPSGGGAAARPCVRVICSCNSIGVVPIGESLTLRHMLDNAQALPSASGSGGDLVSLPFPLVDVQAVLCASLTRSFPHLRTSGSVPSQKPPVGALVAQLRAAIFLHVDRVVDCLIERLLVLDGIPLRAKQDNARAL